MDKTDVAIIGAGPNGLALATFLKAAGVEHVVLGYPFSTWRDHMPKGMALKSEVYGCDVAAPVEGYKVKDFCQATGAEYMERVRPLTLETFLGYADWYARTLVPDVQLTNVSSLAHGQDGFILSGENGLELTARRVVMATGLMPFAYVPALLKSLPADLVSHTSIHTDLAEFRGRRLAVVGAGQSAIETAALLHESGADVELITRDEGLRYTQPNPQPAGLLPGLRRPVTALGEGWHCWCYYNLPDLYRALPEHLRVVKAHTSFGPSGSWWLKPRVEGRFPVRTGARIIEARPTGSHVKLVLDGDLRQEAQYDHVIAGTGYRMDLDCLDFVSSELRRGLSVSGGAPVLSRSFESTVPNLFFVGGMAAPSLGPNMRFLSGTHFTARRLTHRLRSPRPASSEEHTLACVDLSSPAPTT